MLMNRGTVLGRLNLMRGQDASGIVCLNLGLVLLSLSLSMILSRLDFILNFWYLGLINMSFVLLSVIVVLSRGVFWNSSAILMCQE